jgi:glycosyltransferase involved in cell wall biosynthesis
MKVSVIIPVFNRRTYVVRAIDSVMRQTAPVDEIVVIDDGSTDGTAEAIENRYGNTVRVVRQPNSGVSEARRRGVQEARAEWIAFLDSDDEWPPDRNQELLQAAKHLPADVAWLFGDSRFVTDHGDTYSLFEEYGLSLKECPQIFSDSVTIHYPTLFAYLQASFIRREVLLKLSCFKEGLRSSEDVLAAFQVGCQYRFAAIPRAVVNYYRTSDLVSSSLTLNRVFGPDTYHARMMAFATVIKSGRRRPWNSEYARAVRGLCMLLDKKEPSPRTLAFEQFRYGGFSLKGIVFMCFALAGRPGIRFWNAVAASRRRLLVQGQTNGREFSNGQRHVNSAGVEG